MSGPRKLKHIFLWPVVLGILTTIGLVSALIADGIWDAVSWVLLLIPVLLGVAKGWFGKGRR